MADERDQDPAHGAPFDTPFLRGLRPGTPSWPSEWLGWPSQFPLTEWIGNNGKWSDMAVDAGVAASMISKSDEFSHVRVSALAYPGLLAPRTTVWVDFDAREIRCVEQELSSISRVVGTRRLGRRVRIAIAGSDTIRLRFIERSEAIAFHRALDNALERESVLRQLPATAYQLLECPGRGCNARHDGFGIAMRLTELEARGWVRRDDTVHGSGQPVWLDVDVEDARRKAEVGEQHRLAKNRRRAELKASVARMELPPAAREEVVGAAPDDTWLERSSRWIRFHGERCPMPAEIGALSEFDRSVLFWAYSRDRSLLVEHPLGIQLMAWIETPPSTLRSSRTEG